MVGHDPFHFSRKTKGHCQIEFIERFHHAVKPFLCVGDQVIGSAQPGPQAFHSQTA